MVEVVPHPLATDRHSHDRFAFFPLTVMVFACKATNDAEDDGRRRIEAAAPFDDACRATAKPWLAQTRLSGLDFFPRRPHRGLHGGTGRPIHLPVGLQATKSGIKLTFTEPLDLATIAAGKVQIQT